MRSTESNRNNELFVPIRNAIGNINPVVVGSAFRHGVDFLRIDFVLQTLTARLLHQLFLTLEYYAKAPSEKVQQSWLGFPILGGAVGLTTIIKILNCRYKKNYQDYFFVVFSSSILYFFLDNLSQSGEIKGVGVVPFVFTTILIPGLSLILANLVIPDSSSTQFMFLPHHFTNTHFPVYLNASRSEKLLNTLFGMYGFSLSTLFWVINREIHKQSVPLTNWQEGVIAISVLGSTISSYHLTTHPKLFHLMVAINKAVRDSALTYAALSGIGYGIQAYSKPWDEHTESQASFYMILVSSLIGLYSALSTQFLFDKNHEVNIKFIDRSQHAWAKFKQVGATCWNGISSFNFFSWKDKRTSDLETALRSSSNMSITETLS